MQYLLGFGMPGLPEMLIIMVVILVLFGGKQIPSLMRNLGKGATEFKRGCRVIWIAQNHVIKHGSSLFRLSQEAVTVCLAHATLHMKLRIL